MKYTKMLSEYNNEKIRRDIDMNKFIDEIERHRPDSVAGMESVYDLMIGTESAYNYGVFGSFKNMMIRFFKIFTTKNVQRRYALNLLSNAKTDDLSRNTSELKVNLDDIENMHRIIQLFNTFSGTPVESDLKKVYNDIIAYGELTGNYERGQLKNYLIFLLIIMLPFGFWFTLLNFKSGTIGPIFKKNDIDAALREMSYEELAKLITGMITEAVSNIEDCGVKPSKNADRKQLAEARRYLNDMLDLMDSRGKKTFKVTYKEKVKMVEEARGIETHVNAIETLKGFSSMRNVRAITYFKKMMSKNFLRGVPDDIAEEFRDIASCVILIACIHNDSARYFKLIADEFDKM